MKIKLFTILYVYLFLGIVAYAQNPAFYFRQITLTQGLSESTIRDIVEDKQGYMWFCTEDGLNKYDGSKFQVYRSDMNHRNSISSNHPNKLMVDSKGNLWIGMKGGVDRLARGARGGGGLHAPPPPAPAWLEEIG